MKFLRLIGLLNQDDELDSITLLLYAVCVLIFESRDNLTQGSVLIFSFVCVLKIAQWFFHRRRQKDIWLQLKEFDDKIAELKKNAEEQKKILMDLNARTAIGKMFGHGVKQRVGEL